MVPARPATTGAANPQMPAPSTNDPGTHTPADTAAPTTEIYLHEVEEQSKPIDAELAQLAEQRAMHASLSNTFCQHVCKRRGTVRSGT